MQKRVNPLSKGTFIIHEKNLWIPTYGKTVKSMFRMLKEFKESIMFAKREDNKNRQKLSKVDVKKKKMKS